MSSIVAILLLMVKGDKVIIMIKIAFCDDDLSALNEIKVLLDQYRAEHKREIVYAVFCSPFELLAEIEKGMRWDIFDCEKAQRCSLVLRCKSGISLTKIPIPHGKCSEIKRRYLTYEFRNKEVVVL